METVRRVMGAPRQPPLPPVRTRVSLSFDDGYRSQFSLAFDRALLPHHARATFFVSTGGVGRYPGTMTWAQLAALRTAGDEVGGETVHHVGLKRRVAYDRKVQEVCGDRQALVAHGSSATTFAYPKGIYNRVAEQIVSACGYTGARAAGGISAAGRIQSETIPALDPLAIRTEVGMPGPIRLHDLTAAVTAGAAHGGGWVTFILYRVCSRTFAPRVFHSCMASHRPIRLRTLNAFLTWLRRHAPAGTTEATIGQALAEDASVIRS